MISSNTFQFLLAAKQAEIKVLSQLSANCELVTFISELVHQLQRERGMSNVYLASGSELFRTERNAQLVRVSQQEQLLRQALQRLYLYQPDADNSSRLLSAISMALLGMDDLTELRAQITQQKISALGSTEAFSRLINAWQTVVSEAADIASDAQICRLLVSLQHLMQTKELAGQERAWGSIGFAKGCFSADLVQRLTDLEQAQFQAAEQFVGSAPADLARIWTNQENSQSCRDLANLRLMLKQFTGTDCTVPAIADIWYQLATERMDSMQKLQVMMTTELRTQAQQKLNDARQQLLTYQQKVSEQHSGSEGEIRSVLFDPSAPGLYGDASVAPYRLQPAGFSSLYRLLNEQAEHINRINAELEQVKSKAEEYRLLQRAKAWLMQQQKITEAAAHRLLQQQAMTQNCTAVDIARQLVHKAEQKSA